MTYIKKQIDKNVFETTLERIRYIYANFDKVAVSFSGGKDSTAVLQCTLLVARELNKLPLTVLFFDEEAIHPTTIEYVERVSKWPELDFKWICFQIQHRNACSDDEPYWITWDKSKKDLWVRDMPSNAITDMKNVKQPSKEIKEMIEQMYDNSSGKVAILTGIRTQESMRRLRVMLVKKNENYIASKSAKHNTYNCHPIYDWSSIDVWTLIHKFDYDYNKTYDLLNRTRKFNQFLSQRVCPPFGEEPLRGLWLYAECFPELWHKLLNRVPGVATAWRYSNTELYGMKIEKPADITWKEYCELSIQNEPDENIRKGIQQSINSCIRQHHKKTFRKISDDQADPLTGFSWKFFATIAIKKDLKNRTRGSALVQATAAMKKEKINLDETKQKYARKSKHKIITTSKARSGNTKATDM